MKLSTRHTRDVPKKQVLSIIIPSYNAGDRILTLLKKLKTLHVPQVQKEIIVINDASKDPVYKQVSGQEGVIYLEHSKNKGKGGALRTGFKRATGDILLIQDDDLEYDVRNIPKLLSPILSGEAEVVFGSRRLNKKNKYASMAYFLGGSFVNFVVKVFLRQNITDAITGSKVFTRKVYEEIKPIESQGFDIESELTVKIVKSGFRIVEVPIIYSPRTRKEGKNIRWYHAFKLITALWKYS